MAPSTFVLLIVLIGGVNCLPKRWLFDDRCVQDPENGHNHINNPDNGPTNYDVDMTCKNGTFYWNYPTGTINVHFRTNHPFTACFQDDIGANGLEISDITNGASKEFHDFARDGPDMKQCVHSVNNHIDIALHSPMRLYMASLKYYLA